VSVRTYDPREAEVYEGARCSEPPCMRQYHTICRLCNAAFCFDHLKTRPHTCDTHVEFLVLTPEEVQELRFEGNGHSERSYS
jgi:hypothetical protein